MLKALLATTALLTVILTGSAQKASQVIENGIPVKAGEKIFICYSDGKFSYDIHEKALSDPSLLKDSSFFLPTRESVNIYISPPLNPLSFEINTEQKEITDPINEAAATAMISLFTSLDTMGVGDGIDCMSIFTEKVKSIKGKLNDSKKAEIDSAFKDLKKLDFKSKSSTQEKISEIKNRLSDIEKYFKLYNPLIKSLDSIVAQPFCSDDPSYILLIPIVVKDLKSSISEQKKRLSNLKKVFSLVEETAIKATSQESECEWCIHVEQVNINPGKIVLLTLTVKEGGYALSSGEISFVEPKDVAKKTIRIRKFQRFVPEVSAGSAFTFFDYFTYGTTSDSLGQQYVASTGKKSINNLNFTAMINFNYFIPNSPIHPFWQFGMGANIDIPTIFTSLGIRSNINGTRRVAIGVGIAMTWIKRLDKLRVGDKITGSSDIENDLKYKFNWPPKPYIGIQYNF